MTEPSLFDEMDQAAAEICNGWGRLADLQMEFRQLQKARYPDVSEQEWRDLFDHNEAKSEMRIAVLLAERDALNGARASLPSAERAAVDKRLNQGNRREPRPRRASPLPAATWGD